jgi:hypothetical protein
MDERALSIIVLVNLANSWLKSATLAGGSGMKWNAKLIG